VCYIACIVGRILRAALGIAFVLALVGACAAPTLPLPPPAIPNISFAGLPPGQVELSGPPGSVLPGAVVLIVNENNRLPGSERADAAVANSAGGWSKVIYASKGDIVDIYQSYDTEFSSSTTVQIQ